MCSYTLCVPAHGIQPNILHSHMIRRSFDIWCNLDICLVIEQGEGWACRSRVQWGRCSRGPRSAFVKHQRHANGDTSCTFFYHPTAPQCVTAFSTGARTLSNESRPTEASVPLICHRRWSLPRSPHPLTYSPTTRSTHHPG
jgi:hypothetical protein